MCLMIFETVDACELFVHAMSARLLFYKSFCNDRYFINFNGNLE